MPRKPRTREKWEQWKPTLIDWYRTRTADSIAEQLRKDFDLNVTPKMLRDRFKVWSAEPKYNRHQPVLPRRQRRKTRALAGSDAVESRVAVDVRVRCRHGGHYSISGSDLIPTISVPEAHGDLAGPQCPHITSLSGGSRLPLAQGSVLQNVMTHLPSLEPSRTPDTPKEDQHLQKTLKEVAGYIDRIVERGSWISRREKPAFELQALAASAHMAISSPSYDCHHIWHELDRLFNPVSQLMPRFDEDNLLTLHPRVLTVLLQLPIDSLSIGLWGSRTLENVKYMFWVVTSQTLGASHPVRLLCGLPKRKTTEFLFRLIELMDVRLYSRVSERLPDGPKFVAQEQTYAARVLAWLGYTQWASFKMQSVIDGLDDYMDDAFTKADAYRTLGYIAENSCTTLNTESTTSVLEESKTASATALNLFVGMGRGCSNEAMFTRISLAQVSRKLGDLAAAETYLAEAIHIWQRTRRFEDQGGSKLILDFHQVLVDQAKFDEAAEVRQRHGRYFEESRAYDEGEES